MHGLAINDAYLTIYKTLQSSIWFD